LLKASRNYEVALSSSFCPGAFAGFLLLYALLAPIQCLAESTDVANARDILKRGTLEAGIAAGLWQAVDVVHDPPSTNRSAIFVMPKIGIIISDEFNLGLLSGNLEMEVEPQFARFFKPFGAEAVAGVGFLKYNLLSYGQWVGGFNDQVQKVQHDAA
jgi:hypothetical protein